MKQLTESHKANIGAAMVVSHAARHPKAPKITYQIRKAKPASTWGNC
jgi:hypothetical protein